MLNKNSIKKFPITNAHSETVVNLLFALGGFSHVKAVENCMSRLRISISSDSSTEDKEFLALGAVGIVRSPGQVHLIYGSTSIALKEVFSHLLDIHQKPRALSLIASLGGADNISELSAKNNEIYIQLNAPPPASSLDTPWVRNGLSVTIVFSGKDDISAVEIQYALIFWDFLVANTIYEAVHSLGIQKISACRTRLRIEISSKEDPKIALPFLNTPLVLFNSNERELNIPLSSRGEEYVNLLNRLLK
ncbi:MAG: hypothetical protein ACRCY4_09150 [Brevinema sp.]